MRDRGKLCRLLVVITARKASHLLHSENQKKRGGSRPRRVALAKMEGYTNDEIAAQLECAPRTVERKLRLIRSLREAEGV